MSALVERVIASRDRLKPLMYQGEESVRNPAKAAVDALADAANAITRLEEELQDIRRVRGSVLSRIETWWYAVPEEQRFKIMADAAWEKHEAAGPK